MAGTKLTIPANRFTNPDPANLANHSGWLMVRMAGDNGATPFDLYFTDVSVSTCTTRRARTSRIRTGTWSIRLDVSQPRPMTWITRSRLIGEHDCCR